jgi:hypothetical protein
VTILLKPPKYAPRRRKLPLSMVDPKKQALAIYEEICATSADRPFAFRSIEQMNREIAAWQEKNSAFAA